MDGASSKEKCAEPADGERKWDPVFLNARREAIVICAIFATLLVWTIGICYFDGYPIAGVELSMIWGIPRWVFLGVFLPWLAAIGAAYWFCFFYMKDDELSDDQESADAIPGEGNL